MSPRMPLTGTQIQWEVAVLSVYYDSDIDRNWRMLGRGQGILYTEKCHLEKKRVNTSFEFNETVECSRLQGS